MRITTLGLIGFVVFLGFYAYVKYAAAAPPSFSPGYAQNVAILVAMTGVAPYLASLALARVIPGAAAMRIVASALIGAALCVGAYALFFKMFIAGAAPGADIMDVAKRGVGWGAIEGVLAALTIGFARKAA